MRLPGPLYALVRRSMPIACIDLLLHRTGQHGVEVGLIRRRSTASDDSVWGLVGGRVQVGETLAAAAARHLRETLGPGVSMEAVDWDRPALVAQYFPDRSTSHLWDPRQHSIACTYVAAASGDASPAGEATDFRWFHRDAVPGRGEMVPGHDQVLRDLLTSVAALRDPGAGAA